jgi:hypothetical protein
MTCNKWSKPDIKKLKKHFFNMTKKQLLNLFQNRTWVAIETKASRCGIKRDFSKTNVRNKNVCKYGLQPLLGENPIAYYWNGFIMADGSILRRNRGFHSLNYSLSLELSVKDLDHIKKFSKFVNANIMLRTVNAYKKNTKVARVQKNDNNTIPLLINKFNFNKNKTINPPNYLMIKNNNLFIAFIIGFIDGDGSINKKTNTISVECHLTWKKCLQKWFDRLWILSKTKLLTRQMKLPTVKNSYKKDKRVYAQIKISNYNFVNFLKNKAIELNLPILKRKWDRIKNKRSAEK